MAVISSSSERKSQTPTPISSSEAIHGHPEPGPATGGRFYKEDEQRPSMVFKFCPNPTKLWNMGCQDWIACMHVKCSDVPRLMREGFHWDVSNVIKEEGYLEYGKTNAGASSWDVLSTRWYFVADIYQPRRWIASLAVKALNANILYNFNLSRLSRETIRSVSAENQDQQRIYGYRSFTPADALSNTVESPMLGFNVIYDKMPMDGLWPWPQKRNETYVKNGADEGADEKLVPGSSQAYNLKDTVQWKRNLIDVDVDPNNGK